MHFLGLLLSTVAELLGLLIGAYKFIIIASALISWVQPDPYNPIVRFLFQVTNPLFKQIRRILPRSWLRLPIDITPLIALALLIFLERALNLLVYDLMTRHFPH